MPEDASSEEAMEAAWLEWCDAVRRVPELIKRLGRAGDPRVQAEGYRYMARLVTMGLERGFESNDRDFPRLLFSQGPARKIGGDCPDAVYRDCSVHGDGQYRIFGVRGNAAILTLTLARGPARAAQQERPMTIEEISSTEFSFEEDGSFEIWLGGPARPGNWRALPADCERLMIRQFFGAERLSEPAQLNIERLDAPEVPAEYSPAHMQRALATSRLFLTAIPEIWGAEIQRLLEQPNSLARLTAEHQARLQATPGGIPLWGSFQISMGEALIIEFEKPDADYWSLLCGGHWFESLDYRTRICHLNMDHAEPDADGTVRVVLAHDDPGVPNWLESGGNEEGFLLLRCLGCDVAPEPRLKRIPFAQIRSALPAQTPTVSTRERAEQRRKRRQESDRRFEGV